MYRCWFEAFLYLLIGDGGGALWKYSRLLTHYNCC